MDENRAVNKPNSFQVTLESSEYSVAAGKSVDITIHIQNTGAWGDYFKVNLLGIPLNWVTISGPPAVWIAEGENGTAVVRISPPAGGVGVGGPYPARLHVFGQSAPEAGNELELLLNVLPVEKAKQDEIAVPSGSSAAGSQSRVGVTLRASQYSTAPGSSITIPLIMQNRGLEADAFRLWVEGIPVSWVSTASPVTPLEPGKSKEITLVISPPLSPSSQAGRYKITIIVASQDFPDQVTRMNATLTVSAYMKSSIELEPREVEAGKLVRVSVYNDGNTQQVFHLNCASQNNALIFEFQPPERFGRAASPASIAPAAGHATGDPTVLPIPPGESAIFKFTARPRKRQLLGSAVSYPFDVSVISGQKRGPSLAGYVIDRRTPPAWLLLILLLLCVCLPLTFGFRFIREQTRTGSVTATAVAAYTAVAAGPTQTLLAGTMVSANATQTIAANQTAAVLAGQQDTDGDGLTNQREAELGTNPNNADTDGDGLLDGEEVYRTFTNPLDPDSDHDGLRDGDEVLKYKTNPLDPDTDKDAIRDGDEIIFGTNPLNPDTDNDGLVDGRENPNCPYFLNPDTDHDGIIDGKDLDPCDPNNPSLTATAVASRPTSTPIPPPTVVQPTQPSMPKFNGIILFETNRDGNPEIYNMDSAGHIQRMTNAASADYQAAWAPNMQRIAFTSNRSGQNDIYIMNADGTGVQDITNSPSDEQQPAWSPDGQWIVFTSDRDGNYELYKIRLVDFVMYKLTNSAGNDTQPSWARSTTMDPADESILFTSTRDGNLEIYRMKTDGTAQVNLTVNPASDQYPKASPDGSQIAFTTERDGNQEIYTMRIDGKGATNMTQNPANDFGPSWSPDRAWIAYTSERTGNREVFIEKPNSVELYNVTNYPSAETVSDWR